MAQPFDVARPALTAGARFRLRSDGSGGVFVLQTGAFLEIAADQARLLSLLDGQRSVGEVMEAHYATHRSMPLSALDDLLASLAAHGALEGGGPLRAPERRGLSRWLAQKTLWRTAVPGLGVVALLLFAALPVLAWGAAAPTALSATDVLLVLAGTTWAHSLRRWFQGAVLAALGGDVKYLEAGHTGLMPWCGPDVGSLVLLDRPRRALALLAGLAGLGVAFFVAATLSRGLAFGAGIVAVIELCPFAPTLAGRLLATLAGKADLQEHARAFLDRKLLSRVAARSTFEGETSLVWTSMLSLGWLGWVVRLLFTVGAQTSLRLLAVGLEEEGASRALLFSGAGLLVLALPVSLFALFGAVARAFLALRPASAADAGKTTDEGLAGEAKLAEVPLFARLPVAEREAVAAAGERLSFAPGATLVLQGAQGDRFYALLDGRVGVHVEAESGLSRQVATLTAGDCFGEAALLGDGKRLATVRAETAVTVLALGREAFTRLQGQLQADQLASVLRNSAALKKSGFFGALPAERLSSLAFQLVRRTVTPGQSVITRGEAGAECFLVSQGRFEVLGEGDTAVATLGPGDHFGEVALLRDVPRTATVRAAEEGVVLALSREEFLAAVVRDLGLSRRLERLAADRAGAAS
jgi:CRP-like cAMP-binding protein